MTNEDIVLNALLGAGHADGDNEIEALHRLISAKDKAERERDDARKDLQWYFDRNKVKDERIDALTAALRKASEAMEPFAKIGDIYNHPEKAKCTDEMVSAAYSFFIGEFRRACAAMADAEKALGGALPATEALS
jgi:hypothetical protein